ncbi:unnamed protein product [Lactuca saligna]|uniref:non-specific serine/threonine protein kinase n=1 Tax=Lactuca saligna TaxID=75948 RepID=A0AA36EPL3_LACSI|nr:unnamed protein product [Lactuca saligna]
MKEGRRQFFCLNNSTLEEIAKQMGKRHFDFSLNACDGNLKWTSEMHLSLKGQDLKSVLPSSLAKLHYVSDLNGNRSQLLNLSSMTNMEILILRCWRISDSISEMSKLRHLDLSFNDLEGDIPYLKGLDLEKMGQSILRNFDITVEVCRVDKALKKEIKYVNVSNITLDIRFQYARKATTAVPSRGSYGPLISSISMVSDLNPPFGDKSKKTIVIVVVAGNHIKSSEDMLGRK